MHVAQLNFQPAPADFGIQELLEHWPSLADIAELVAGAGIRVSVLQAASHAEHMTRNGVCYRFINIDDTRSVEERGRCFAKVLLEMDVDVLHAHGLRFVDEASVVARHLSPALPVVFQDHADRLPRWWRRPHHRRGFAGASGVAFTSLDQARPFVDANLFPASTRLFAIPESSSRFTPGDRTIMRAETGLHGNPGILWVGRLNRVKDPLTVLEGVALATTRLPDLHLWCVFGAAPMLSDVRARIEGDSRLAGRVHLLGRLPHARIKALLRAADLFVSGSRVEGSGYAAIEALACGVTPVLTDIPAFRALTGNGRVGHLWPCGDATGLAGALWVAANECTPRARVRAHFEAALSFEAVGRLWAAAYSRVCEDRRRRAA
ncbi:MAG: glycosyltransferase [Rhodanobacteraceae bacterium]|nr:MAG: glycosyltransferase [Rhodanobacteraceae bacterium]